MKTMKLELMKEAIKKAKKSGKDIPIGAIIVKDGEIITKAVNQREKKQNTIYHAEIVAIKRACRKLKNWRLNDCEMYVTLEPCPMCMWAILEARIDKLFFGAYDTLYGGSTVLNLKDLANSKIEIKGGILEDECSTLVKNYFAKLRNKK